MRLGIGLVAAWLLLSASLAAAQLPEPAAPRPIAALDHRQALPAPPSEEVPLFSLNGAARGGVPWIVNPPKARDDVFGFGAADFVLAARPTREVTVLVDVESLGGPGPDVALRSLTRVFVRAGVSRSDGQSVTAQSWSAGVQHTPAWLGRGKDLGGIGYDFLRNADGHAHVTEAYDNLSPAACCSVIANVEWLRSRPTGHHHDDRVVPGRRAVILY